MPSAGERDVVGDGFREEEYRSELRVGGQVRRHATYF